jgi:hypothetical protein
MPLTSPAAVVQAQLDAFNAKDIDALLMAYAPDAEQYQLHGGLLARGHEAMRERYLARFGQPGLSARLISRTCMENIVIDHEVITRDVAEGVAAVEMICVYEIAGGRIQKASFAAGKPTLQSPSAA